MNPIELFIQALMQGQNPQQPVGGVMPGSDGEKQDTTVYEDPNPPIYDPISKTWVTYEQMRQKSKDAALAGGSAQPEGSSIMRMIAGLDSPNASALRSTLGLPSMTPDVPTFNPPSPSGGAALGMLPQDQMASTGSVSLYGRPPAPVTQSNDMPAPRGMAFRTPDLIAALASALVGGREGIGGFLKGKMGYADQQNQYRQQNWQQQQASQAEASKQAFEASQNALNRQNQQDLWGNRTQGAVDLQTEKNKGLVQKYDSTQETAILRSMTTAGPDQRPVFAGLLRTMNPAKFGGLSDDEISQLGKLTPKEQVEKSIVPLNESKKLYTDALTGLTVERTTDLKTFRPYKVKEMIAKNDLMGAQAESNRASANLHRVIARLAPAMQVARIKSLTSAAAAAQKNAEAHMISSNASMINANKTDGPTATSIMAIQDAIDQTQALMNSHATIVKNFQEALDNPTVAASSDDKYKEAYRDSVTRAYIDAKNALVGETYYVKTAQDRIDALTKHTPTSANYPRTHKVQSDAELRRMMIPPAQLSGAIGLGPRTH